MGIPLTNVVRSERAAAEIAESARGPVILDGPDLAEHGLALTDGAPPTLAYKRWFGVEPICRVLMEHGTRIAPSTSYAAKSRPRSARAVSEGQLLAVIERVWEESFRCYGVVEMWHALRREGYPVGRDRVAG